MSLALLKSPKNATDIYVYLTRAVFIGIWLIFHDSCIFDLTFLLTVLFSSVKLITAVRRALAPLRLLVEWNHKWHKQGLARS